MNTTKKALSILLTAILCLFPLIGSVMTVRADGPVTYYAKYVAEEDSWEFQTGSTWNDSAMHYQIQHMLADIKDGDLLIIDGDDANKELTFEVPVALNNLTIVHSSMAIITAKSIDYFYALNNSGSVINGNVKNAFIYDSCLCNFNNDVAYMELLSEKNDKLAANIAVAGTVGHVKASGKSYTHFELYNFAANTFRIENGDLMTAPANFSDTAPAATPAPVTPSAPSAGSTSSGEYDDVPKTGEYVFAPFWLLLAALVCLTAGYTLKTK